MNPAKSNQSELSPELINYFQAINLHMRVHKRQPHLITSLSTFKINDPGTVSSSSSCLINPIDDTKEQQQISKMMETTHQMEQALLCFDDPKKLKLAKEFEDTFDELWSRNFAVVSKSVDYLKSIFKDVHRYWPYLEGQVDRLVMACSRVLRLIYIRYIAKAPIITLLNSTAQLFHSILLKSPLLPSKISTETCSNLLESLFPFYLLSTDESKSLDQRVQPKIETFITDMFSVCELNNLLLALLQKIHLKLSSYNQIHDDNQMNILIKWIEQLSNYLSDTKISNLTNLDLILKEADILIRAYPGSLFENSRDFRLLEAVREIVFKIVEHKGDPKIFSHLTMIDLDQGDFGLIKYINIALERKRLIKHLNPPVKPLPSRDVTDDVPFEEQLSNYKPIIPNGLQMAEQEMDSEADPDQELFMFKHFLNNLASTSDSIQAKIALDYLNQNFDDLVSKFPDSLEPMIDLLIRACTRQYHLFTTLYYPPNVGLASCQSLQMLHSATSLLKRIFTSTISLKSVTRQTMSHLILLIFSLRLSWTSDFSVEDLTQLESSILTNESLDKSALICVCIRIMRNSRKLTQSTDIQRFARQMLTELILPLQFVTFTMMAEQYDLKGILYEINEYLLTCDDEALEEDFDRFLVKAKQISERSLDYQTVIEQLIYEIVRQSRYFIYDNLKLFPTETCTQLQRFNKELLELLDSGAMQTNPQDEVGQRKAIRFTKVIPQFVLNQLDYFQAEILLNFRVPKHPCNLDYFTEKLTEMATFYDTFVDYPELMRTVVDSFTEACTCMMKHYQYSLEGLSIFRNDLVKMFSKVGALLHKMYGSTSARGHDLVSKEMLTQLCQDNIFFILEHCNLPQTVLDRDFGWMWSLQHSLVQHSKPKFLLSIALEELISLLKFGDFNKKNSRENYLLVRMLASMLDTSVGQMFLYPNAVYKHEMVEDKFYLKSFFKQLDEVFNYYPTSFLEAERDYKILVLLKRGLTRLYRLHGLSILDYCGKVFIRKRSESPVYAFFEQLISQSEKIKRVEIGDIEKEDQTEEEEVEVLVKKLEAIKVAVHLKVMEKSDELTYEDLIEGEQWDEYEEDDDDEFDDFELVSEFIPEFVPEQTPK